MDLFRFLNPNAPTLLEQGEVVSGLTNIMWIERYREAGEFSLTAKVDSDIRNLLPIGTFVSHVDTEEVMIVENHEISDDKGSASEITVTGRGYETFLENRIVGANRIFPSSGILPEYTLAVGPAWQQVKTLIENHILSSNVYDPNDAVPYVSVLSTVPTAGNVDARIIERGDLYSRLLEILAFSSLGIKVVRPGSSSPLGPTSQNAAFVIHEGVDRSANIIFSNDIGDIKSADYLWSNKRVKNCALVTGRWLETMVKATLSGYDRRVMHVDASDIDNAYTTEPVGVDRTIVLNNMIARANQALANQQEIAIAKVEASRILGVYTYGVDFGVGDLVMVDGGYDETTIMRVSEYVRIEDKNGESGYPTLSMF